MSITLELTPDIQRDLERAAKKAGLTPDAYVLATLREHLPKPDKDKALTENFNEVYENVDSRLEPALRSAARKAFERNEW